MFRYMQKKFERMNAIEDRAAQREQRELEREKMADERDKTMIDLLKTLITTQAQTEQVAQQQQTATTAMQENP
jgi:hypothetical protein